MSSPDITYEFPDDFIESLVCSHCKSYLSCGPIKVNPDGATICGRCSGSNIEGSIRENLFEVVLAKFAFPCRFKKEGCKQQLLFGAVKHEDVCPYRTFACPSLPHGACTQDISVFGVYKHFEEAHSDLIIKDNKFRLDLQADVQCNLLASTKDGVAAVQYMYDSDKQDFYLDIAHFSNDPQKRLSYKLQIVSGSDVDRSLSFKDYSCHLYECHAINQQTARNFKICDYLPALEHPTFVLVNIMVQCVEHGANSGENFSQAGVVNSLPLNNVKQKIGKLIDALEKFRCSHCRCIAIPPVYKKNTYSYEWGANLICYDCKITNSFSNLSPAEELVKIPEFPCRWRQCSFVGNETTIRDHISSCQFRTYLCPLSQYCNGFYTRNTMMNHIQQHGGQFHTDPERIVIDLFCKSSTFKNQHFTMFNNELVALTCNIQQEYIWSLNTTFTFDIYFEHEHCSFKSKTLSWSPGTDYQYFNIINQLPVCFAKCKYMWAVLKVPTKLS